MKKLISLICILPCLFLGAALADTFFAGDDGNLGRDDFVGDGDEDIPGLHFAYVNDPGSGLCADGKYSRGSKTELLSDTVTINGNEYYVVVFTDAKEEAIPYGDSLHTLNAVWMDANVTQEQVAGWGEKVEIIVFSQGIQSYDLTHAEAMEALGEVNQENLTKWIG